MVATAQLRRDFWQAFAAHMAAISDIGCSRPSAEGWMWHTADLSAGYLASLIRVRLHQIGVRFRLNGPNSDTVFAYLESQRQSVDAAIDEPLLWRSVEGSHVIDLLVSGALEDRGSWPVLTAWLQERLEALRNALWPHVGRVPPARPRQGWNEELFFNDLATWNPSCTLPAKRILQAAGERDYSISWGSGGQVGSYTLSIPRHGAVYQLGSVRTDGTLQLLFSRLRETPLFSQRSSRLELLERVNQVRCMRLPGTSVDQRPAVPLALLGDGETCLQFVDVLTWFGEATRTG